MPRHAADLVRAHGIQIDIFAQTVQKFAERLHAVAVKDRSGVDLFDRTRNLVDIVDRARFVIDVNDRNQRSFAVDFFQKIVYVHAAVPVEARAAHFDPPPRKFRRGGKYGGMLALGYDDVAAPSRGKKRLIIRAPNRRR